MYKRWENDNEYEEHIRNKQKRKLQEEKKIAETTKKKKERERWED